jgi:hypothetical protein
MTNRCTPLQFAVKPLLLYSVCYRAFILIIMSEIKQHIDCTYCGLKKTVTVTTKDTTHSRSVKVGKCRACKRQVGVKAALNAI